MAGKVAEVRGGHESCIGDEPPRVVKVKKTDVMRGRSGILLCVGGEQSRVLWCRRQSTG